MTDCGCDKAKAELEEYLHRELSDGDLADISDHLAQCVDCNAEHLIGLTLTEKVRSACQEKAPEELRSAVLGRLSTLAASQPEFLTS
jgi:anti-sigma factor (TIGR02949 family)